MICSCFVHVKCQFEADTLTILIPVLGQNGSGQDGMDKMVYGQNGIGQNGMDKMVRIKYYG